MKRKCPTCPSTSWISSHNEVKLPCKFVPYDTSVSWACIVIHRCLWWIWPFLGSWRQVRVTFDRKPAGTRMPLPPWPKVPAWPICTPTCVRFCTCTWCSLHIFVSARVFKVRVCTLVYDYAHNYHVCICTRRCLRFCTCTCIRICVGTYSIHLHGHTHNSVVYTSLFQHGYLQYVSAPLYMIMHTMIIYVSVC